MKKKLNLFCILMLVLMVAQVFVTFIVGADAFAEGYRKGVAGDEPTTWADLLSVLLGFIVLISAVVSFVCFLRFILNVNHNKVFVWDNVLLLRLTGIGLFIISLVYGIDECSNGGNYAEVFEESFGILIFSVFNLIVAEVFAIGLKLKEEQDLTI